MSRKTASLLIMLIFLCSGCEDNLGQFRVKIVTPNRQPAEGVTVEGGLDWESFQVKTDSQGIAILPIFAFNYNALIYKNNFFPKLIDLTRSAFHLPPYTYIITPTPEQLKPIGDVEGWSIQFDQGTLVTIDYHGGYHVYSYSNQGILEILSIQLPTSSVRDTQLRGNTLWFSTHDDGIYVYSLEDPFDPQLLYHLNITGYLGKFAINDSAVVVGNPWNREELRVYSYNTSGEIQELSRFGNHLGVNLNFRDDYLIVLDYHDHLPAVYDLHDPENPFLVYNGIEPDYWHGFLYENYLILIPKWELIGEKTNYKIIDLSDPANPSTAGFFYADSRLTQIIDENTALGRYHIWSGATSLLRGNIASDFKTTAIVTDNPWVQNFLHQFEGCSFPFFIIGKRLYKLEEQ
ncbi:MAG: hypothetical protein OEY25_10625 [Candidatus Aminicenantes bacterium]|nr:hypothetical protein [Candidatus Aminicenantes bacterium]